MQERTISERTPAKGSDLLAEITRRIICRRITKLEAFRDSFESVSSLGQKAEGEMGCQDLKDVILPP
jgi:hypothetical protein